MKSRCNKGALNGTVKRLSTFLMVVVISLLGACQNLGSANTNNTSPINGKTYTYQCQSINEVDITFISVDKIELNFDNQRLQLNQAIAASGTRYQSKVLDGKQWQWWSKGLDYASLSYEDSSGNEDMQSCQLK